MKPSGVERGGSSKPSWFAMTELYVCNSPRVTSAPTLAARR
jgi:hypothetical protein